MNLVGKLENIKKSRFWDNRKDVVLTKKFGVISGLALFLVKVMMGKEEVKISCSDALALKDFAELIDELQTFSFTIGEPKMENGFPAVYVTASKK